MLDEKIKQELMALSKEELVAKLENEYQIRMETVEAWKRDSTRFKAELESLTTELSQLDDENLNILEHNTLDTAIANAARNWAQKSKWRAMESFEGDPSPLSKEVARSPIDCGLLELWNLVK